MNITLGALTQQLNQALSPIYLISGDEHLLVQEASQQVREAAKRSGFDERIVLDISAHFDWNHLTKAAASRSFFSSQTLIELRFSYAKVTASDTQALLKYTPQKNRILLVIMPKLTKAQSQASWIQKITQAGIFLPIPSITPDALPGWIRTRMHDRGLSASPLAINQLAQCTEGNLLSTAQAIEKLHLLYGKSHITDEHMSLVFENQAQYNTYQLSNACLQGNAVKALRILDQLRLQDAPCTWVLWTLWQEINRLKKMKQALQYQNMDAVCTAFRVFYTQKNDIKQALNRLSFKQLDECMKQSGYIDKINKGIRPGDAWTACTSLVLLLSGYDATA